MSRAARPRGNPLAVVKALLSWSQLKDMSAVLMPAQGGRGLTYLAQAEWGRCPADLVERELAWLFAVALWPHCSIEGKRTLSEPERQSCESLYRSLLAGSAPRMSPSAQTHNLRLIDRNGSR